MQISALRSAVDIAVRDGNPSVRDAVVASLTRQELDTRATNLIAVIVKREELQKKLDAIKPQPATFDADGKPGPAVFTAQQHGERKKLKEQLDKIDSAYNKAFHEKPDWTELKKLAAGEQQQGSS